jgi:hypothetical protein
MAMGWLNSTGGVIRHIFRKRERAIPESPTNPDLMILRGGLSPSFYFFCQVFAKEHGLTAVPDRRTRDRRHAQRTTPTFDRRAQERRGELVRWPLEDFIIVRDKRYTRGANES